MTGKNKLCFQVVHQRRGSHGRGQYGAAVGECDPRHARHHRQVRSEKRGRQERRIRDAGHFM